MWGDYVGSPLELVEPQTLRWKVMEPVLLLGKHRFANVDIRIRVKGGGHVSQIYGKQIAPFLEYWNEIGSLQQLALRFGLATKIEFFSNARRGGASVLVDVILLE